jgi:uncharacterized surface protein with fasciclin (FAS1) repeats
MRKPSRVAVATCVVAGVLALVAAACGSSTPATPSTPTMGLTPFTPTAMPSPSLTPSPATIVKVGSLLDAAKSANLTTFVTAVAAAGMQKALAGNLPFTAVAPSDEAFKKISLDQLKKSLPQLKSVIEYHFVPAENLRPADIKNHYKAMSYEGSPLLFTANGSAMMVNDANVTKVIEGPDFTIYVVDKVLVPRDIAAVQMSPSP